MVYMFWAIWKFPWFRKCAAQIRNYVIANKFRNGKANLKIAQHISKFRYKTEEWPRDDAGGTSTHHERQRFDTAKNPIPIEMSKTISKDKGQKIVQQLKINTVAHDSSSGWKRVRFC